MHSICSWEEIKHDYKDGCLILGNGSSIALNSNFNYKSLLGEAKKTGVLGTAEDLFNSFETTDFELILRHSWHAAKVNSILGINEKNTLEAYRKVRDSLIRVVRSIHPTYQEALDAADPLVFDRIAKFARGFRVVLSLNYDLLLYWSIIKSGNRGFRDLFSYGEFNSVAINETFNHMFTYVFYPHGNLFLNKDESGLEKKVDARGGLLLDRILEGWEQDTFAPVFISEGTCDKKIESIKRSFYLNTIYDRVLPIINQNLVIYGWGVAEQDSHILNKLHFQSGTGDIRKIAVSVYGNDQDFCSRVNGILNKKFPGNKVQFFNSQSEGCWSN